MPIASASPNNTLVCVVIEEDSSRETDMTEFREVELRSERIVRTQTGPMTKDDFLLYLARKQLPESTWEANPGTIPPFGEATKTALGLARDNLTLGQFRAVVTDFRSPEPNIFQHTLVVLLTDVADAATSNTNQSRTDNPDYACAEQMYEELFASQNSPLVCGYQGDFNDSSLHQLMIMHLGLRGELMTNTLFGIGRSIRVKITVVGPSSCVCQYYK